MTPSFREILEVLNQHQIEFIVVGGVAAVIHGAPTTTFDLDTLVRLNEANAERLARALSKLEARFRERRTTIRPTVEDILAGGHLLLMTRAGPLDVLGFIVAKMMYGKLNIPPMMILGNPSTYAFTFAPSIQTKRGSKAPCRKNSYQPSASGAIASFRDSS